MVPAVAIARNRQFIKNEDRFKHSSGNSEKKRVVMETNASHRRQTPTHSMRCDFLRVELKAFSVRFRGQGLSFPPEKLINLRYFDIYWDFISA